MRADAIVGERSAIVPKVRSGLPRWLEVIVAAVGLLVASPIILVAALGVALTSGFPVFFRQKRVGQYGGIFSLCKLRTMNSSVGGPQITSNADTRITSFGRFLRHTKVDELPTLWNVVRGDMSLVGPRPEVPRFVQLADPIWQKVLAVRPGITDPVTLKLRSESELLAQTNGDTEAYYVNQLQPAKLRGYLAYLEERTWRSDLKVLLQTAAAVVVPGEASPLLVEDVLHLGTAKDEFRAHKPRK